MSPGSTGTLPLGVDPRKAPCQVHRHHGSARPLLTVYHHVWPRGMGGPDTPENKVALCATGHYNVHHLMGCLIFGRPLPRRANRKELDLADRGVQAWLDAGRPGNPNAAWG